MSEAAGLEAMHLPDGALLFQISGNWTVHSDLPSAAHVQSEIAAQPETTPVRFDAGGLSEWDSSLVIFLMQVQRFCGEQRLQLDVSGLPAGARRLIEMASAVPPRQGAQRSDKHLPWLDRVGLGWMAINKSFGEMASFVGEAFFSVGRFFAGQAKFQVGDLFFLIKQCGIDALAIVSLISILIGLTMAFVGSVQLKMFGAQIYVANLVSLLMAREMAPMMTAIIMAGRTGASFAAQLGTMQVNQEIDALKTLGIPPMDFLVLPRIVALIAMMPLLCIYADAVGLFGGFLVGVGMLDLSPFAYYDQSLKYIHVHDFMIGIIKSAVFGVIIAVVGCQRGLACGRSAAAVGEATTSAVVIAIVSIIVIDGLFAVMTTILGI